MLRGVQYCILCNMSSGQRGAGLRGALVHLAECLWRPAATDMAIFVHGKLLVGQVEKIGLATSSTTAAWTITASLKLPPPQTSALCYNTRCVTTPPTVGLCTVLTREAGVR